MGYVLAGGAVPPAAGDRAGVLGCVPHTSVLHLLHGASLRPLGSHIGLYLKC